MVRFVSCLGLLGLFGVIGAAQAADMPVKAHPPAQVSDRWSGFYFGLNGGYGDPRGTDISATNAGNFGGGFGTKLRATTTNAIPTHVGSDPRGFVGGGQFGYNWHFAPMWVAGLEADLQFSDMKGSGSATGFASATGPTMSALATANASQTLDWFGTLRARGGYLAAPNFLLYGTGGLAFGHVKGSTSIVENCFNVCNPIAAGAGSGSADRAGWTAGGGFEWAVDSHWSVKTEYLYVHLGDLSYANGALNFDGPLSSVRTTSTAHFNSSIGRVGVNYRF